MRRIAYTFLIILLLINCSEIKKNQSDIRITLYESYDLVYLYPSLIKANHEIRKLQHDSIVKISSGIKLLDEMNRENAAKGNTESSSMEDYPIFQILSPIIAFHSDGKTYIDSSALIGITTDSILLNNYLKQTCSLFPEDLRWIITGKVSEKYKRVHAIKLSTNAIILSNTDVDSLIITPNIYGLLQMGNLNYLNMILSNCIQANRWLSG